MERNNQRVALPAPSADILAVDHHIAQSLGYGNSPFGDRGTGDEVINQCAAVDSSLAQRIKVKHIGLHAPIKQFDVHRGRPARFTDAKGLLEVCRGLGKVGQRLFHQQVCLSHRNPKTGRADDSNVATHRFCSGVFDSWQNPILFDSGFTFFQVQRNQLTSRNVLPKDNLQVATTVCDFGSCDVIRHARARDRDD